MELGRWRKYLTERNRKEKNVTGSQQKEGLNAVFIRPQETGPLFTEKGREKGVGTDKRRFGGQSI